MSDAYDIALARVPGLGGYIASQNLRQRQGMGELQQAGALQGILMKKRALEQDQALRGALSQLPPDATPEQVAKVIMPFHPDKAATLLASIQDKEATREYRDAQLEFLKDKAADDEIRRGNELVDKEIAAGVARDEEHQNRMALAQAMAGLRQPPAPSITTLVDPTDKSRMITVDTRTYKGGGIGSPGVIGMAGKEPSAAKRDEEKAAGVQNLKDTVGMLEGAYNNLENMGAGVSPSQNFARNAYERVAASGAGQLIAGGVGTKAQTERDKIAMARANLMAAMKQATGMSAQALNSNAELMFYLQAATDPTKSREANKAALAYMDKRFKLGLGIKAPEAGIKALQQQAPAQSEGAIGGPSIDSLLEKYK